MDLLHVIILAVVEGITEFLPISSTSHLIVAQRFLGIKEVNEFFTVVLQLGAILAAVFYFKGRIIDIFKDSMENIKKQNYMNDLGTKIVIAIIPTLVIGFVATKFLDKLQNSILLIGISTIVFGIVFYVVEVIYMNKKKIETKELSLKNLLLMGIAQGIAVIPGVSRSGATITTGVSQGLKLKDSIEISFIMGIPVMIAASGFELIKSIHSFSSSLALETIIGLIVSFVTGYIGVKLTLGFLGKNGFLPFMLYRIFFGIFIIIVLR